MFILAPDAGRLLHPAHRLPDQTVKIWPASPAPFRFRSLVWVAGLIARTKGRRDGVDTMYAITGAEIHAAVQSDITLWFKP